MTYKHTFVDDYPYLTYASGPDATQASSSDVATIDSEIDALDARLDLIEANNWVDTDRIKNGAVTLAKLDGTTINKTPITPEA